MTEEEHELIALGRYYKLHSDAYRDYAKAALTGMLAGGSNIHESHITASICHEHAAAQLEWERKWMKEEMERVKKATKEEEK